MKSKHELPENKMFSDIENQQFMLLLAISIRVVFEAHRKSIVPLLLVSNVLKMFWLKLSAFPLQMMFLH